MKSESTRARRSCASLDAAVGGEELRAAVGRERAPADGEVDRRVAAADVAPVDHAGERAAPRISRWRKCRSPWTSPDGRGRRARAGARRRARRGPRRGSTTARRSAAAPRTSSARASPCSRAPSGRTGARRSTLASCSARRNAPSGRPSAQRASRSSSQPGSSRAGISSAPKNGQRNRSTARRPTRDRGRQRDLRRELAQHRDLALDARDRDLAAREAERPALVDEPDRVVPALAEQLERARARSTARRSAGARAPASTETLGAPLGHVGSRMMSADLAFAGLARQAQLVREGEVSARELVELSLERIERFDPQLNAFGAVYAEQALHARPSDAAARAAVAACRSRSRTRWTSPARSPAAGPARSPSPRRADSEVVRRLRGRGRDRDRQDDDARARAVAVHRVDHLGRDAQPVGHRPHAGRVERRLGGRGRRRPRARPRSPPTARARSASRPRAAGCSASSRTAGRVPRTPHDDDGGALDLLRRPHALGRRRAADARRDGAGHRARRAAAPLQDRLLRGVPAAARAASSTPETRAALRDTADAAARPRPRGRRARPRLPRPRRAR